MSDPYRSEDDAQRVSREARARAEQRAREAAAPLTRDIRATEDARDRARRRLLSREEADRHKTLRDGIVGPVGQYLDLFIVWVLPFGAIFAIGFGYLKAAWWLVPLGVVGLLFIPARWLVERQLVDRELRWLASLPFAARGYAETLGTRMANQGKVSVEVRLADESAMPDDPFCRRIFGGVVHSVRVERGVVRITSPALQCPDVPDNSAGTRYSTHKIRRWLRTLLAGMLVPFHEAFPIREVEIASISPYGSD